MRIRTIKPEFWRSDDIAALNIEDRLLFIGLWSYVDDSGVGEDKPASICGDLFAPDMEKDAPEVFARVRRGLQELSDRGLIVRYEVGGKSYLAIVTWTKHQRIDKPSKSRYPGPEQAEHKSSRSTPGGLREPSTVGTGEQGNRGTGEQGSSAFGGAVADAPPAPAAAAVAVADDQPPTAQTLVAEWLDHCNHRPPRNVIGQTSKQIKALLEEGIDPEQVRAGLAHWHSRGLHPSALPSAVNEVMNARPARATVNGHQPSTTERKVQAALEAGARVQAMFDQQHQPRLEIAS